MDGGPGVVGGQRRIYFGIDTERFFGRQERARPTDPECRLA